MAKIRWADLSGTQKAGIVALSALQVSLLGAALWDLAHRSAEEVRGDRRMWAGLVFINWVGPLAYFTVGRKRSIWTASRPTSASEAEQPGPAT